MPSLVATPVIPHQAARFVVRVEKAPGVAMTARFSSCSELAAEVAKSELWAGGSMIPYKEAARVTFADITLERGATSESELFNWFALTVAPTPAIGGVGRAHARMVDIAQLDRANRVAHRWRLVNAFVVGYKAGEWDGDSDEFLMESVTLTFDFFKPVGIAGALGFDQISSLLP